VVETIFAGRADSLCLLHGQTPRVTVLGTRGLTVTASVTVRPKDAEKGDGRVHRKRRTKGGLVPVALRNVLGLTSAP
jgi:hypothetical protein